MSDGPEWWRYTARWPAGRICRSLEAGWAVLVVAVVVAAVCGGGVGDRPAALRARGARDTCWTVTGFDHRLFVRVGRGLGPFPRQVRWPAHRFYFLPQWMVLAGGWPDERWWRGAVRDTAPVVFEADKGDGERALSIGEERRRATQLQILNRLACVLGGEEDATRMLDQVLRGATQLLGARAESLYLMAAQLEARASSGE